MQRAILFKTTAEHKSQLVTIVAFQVHCRLGTKLF